MGIQEKLEQLRRQRELNQPATPQEKPPLKQTPPLTEGPSQTTTMQVSTSQLAARVIDAAEKAEAKDLVDPQRARDVFEALPRSPTEGSSISLPDLEPSSVMRPESTSENAIPELPPLPAKTSQPPPIPADAAASSSTPSLEQIVMDPQLAAEPEVPEDLSLEMPVKRAEKPEGTLAGSSVVSVSPAPEPSSSQLSSVDALLAESSVSDNFPVQPLIPDESQSVQPADEGRMQPGTQIQVFIEEMRSSPMPVAEKHRMVKTKAREEAAKLKEAHGEKGLLNLEYHAMRKQPHERSPEEQQYCDLKMLEEFANELGAMAVNAAMEQADQPSVDKEAPTKKNDAPTEPPKVQKGLPELAKEIQEQRPAARPSPNPAGTSDTQLTSQLSYRSTIMKNPITYFVTSIGAFTGAMVYTNGFMELAEKASSYFGPRLPSLPSADVLTYAIEGVYGAVLAGALLFTEKGRWKRAKKEALHMEMEDKKESKYREQKTYIVEEFTKILREYPDVQSQGNKIREAMANDEVLFAYVDLFLENHYMKTRMFEAVDLHPSIVKKFGDIHRSAETALIMKKYFAKLAPFLNNREVRRDMLAEMHTKSPLFRKKLGQLFEKAKDGSPKNSEMHDRFAMQKFEDEQKPERMTALLAELDRDYARLLEINKGAEKKK